MRELNLTMVLIHSPEDIEREKMKFKNFQADKRHSLCSATHSKMINS